MFLQLPLVVTSSARVPNGVFLQLPLERFLAASTAGAIPITTCVSSILNGTSFGKTKTAPSLEKKACETAALCCTRCAANARCTAWSWWTPRKGSSMCNLLSGTGWDEDTGATKAVSGAMPSPPPPPPPPHHIGAKNFLYMMVDDLRTTLGYRHNETTALTPNLDALASSGFTFAHAYCQHAVCAPSRSSFMSGLRPETLKIYTFTSNFRESKAAGKTWVPHPEHYKRNGYLTLGGGKTYVSYPEHIRTTRKTRVVRHCMLWITFFPPHLSPFPSGTTRDVPQIGMSRTPGVKTERHTFLSQRKGARQWVFRVQTDTRILSASSTSLKTIRSITVSHMQRLILSSLRALGGTRVKVNPLPSSQAFGVLTSHGVFRVIGGTCTRTAPSRRRFKQACILMRPKSASPAATNAIGRCGIPTERTRVQGRKTLLCSTTIAPHR